MRIARVGRQRPARHACARRRNGLEVGRRHDALPWRPGGRVTRIVSGAQTRRALGQRQLVRIQCLRHHRVIADHRRQFDHAARAPAAQHGVVRVRRHATRLLQCARELVNLELRRVVEHRAFECRDGIDDLLAHTRRYRGARMHPPLDLRRPTPSRHDDREFVEAWRQTGAVAQKLAERRPCQRHLRAVDRRAQRTDHLPARTRHDGVVETALLGVHVFDVEQWNARALVLDAGHDAPAASSPSSRSTSCVC